MAGTSLVYTYRILVCAAGAVLVAAAFIFFATKPPNTNPTTLSSSPDTVGYTSTKNSTKNTRDSSSKPTAKVSPDVLMDSGDLPQQSSYLPEAWKNELSGRYAAAQESFNKNTAVIAKIRKDVSPSLQRTLTIVTAQVEYLGRFDALAQMASDPTYNRLLQESLRSDPAMLSEIQKAISKEYGGKNAALASESMSPEELLSIISQTHDHFVQQLQNLQGTLGVDSDLFEAASEVAKSQAELTFISAYMSKHSYNFDPETHQFSRTNNN